MKFDANYAAAALAALAALSGTAMAATATANLSVSATVLDTCQVSVVGALVFTNPSATTATNETVPGNIVVVCTATRSNITVTLGAGGNVDGSQRRMANVGGALLPYSIFSDGGRTSAVGIDGEVYNAGITAAVPVPITVYGQIPAGTYTAGAYSDTVVVTLNY